MSVISAFFKGIIYTFSMLSPLSYSGHDSLFKFTAFDLTKGGYDSILPLVVYASAIAALIYFLKKDLVTLAAASGSLLKDIKGKKLDLNTDDKDKHFLIMIIMGALTLILTPLLELIFKGMSSQLLITAAGFLISALFVIFSLRAKEKSLKESNETILNGMLVSVFCMFSVIPGISAFGGMYFAGVLNGFRREFSAKYAYTIILIWSVFSFLRNLISGFIFGFNISYGILYYIFAAVGAIGISGVSIYLFNLALKYKKTSYYAAYNIVIAVITLAVWLRG